MLSSTLNRPLVALRWLIYALFAVAGLVTPFLQGDQGQSVPIKGLWGAGAVACFLTLYGLTELERTSRLTFQRLGLMAGETALVMLLTTLYGGTNGPYVCFLIVPPLLISLEHHWKYGLASALALCLFLGLSGGKLDRAVPVGVLALALGGTGAALSQVETLRKSIHSDEDYSKLDRAYQIARRETTKRQENEEELYRERRRFEGLVSVAQGLSEEREEESLLRRIVEVAADQLSARAAIVFAIKEGQLVARAELGLSHVMVEALQKSCNVAMVEKLAQAHRILSHGCELPEELDRANQDMLTKFSRLIDPEAHRNPSEVRIDQLLGVPLASAQDSHPLGFLLILNNNFEKPFSETEARYLQVLSTNAAVALKNIFFTAQLERSHWELIQALAQAIEAKDSYTSNHVGRVRDLSVEIARTIGLNREQTRVIAIAATLHDVGKISTPDRVLLKPGPLTDEEYEIMKLHAPNGAQILRNIHSLPPGVEPMVRHHHERWDGKGYPDKIAGKDIPLGAQIISIADCYDAMTYDRPYRKGFPQQEALKKMEMGCGTQFNPKLLCAFFAIQGYVPTTEPTAIDTYHSILNKLHLGGRANDSYQELLGNSSQSTGPSDKRAEQRRKPLLMERN